MHPLLRKPPGPARAARLPSIIVLALLLLVAIAPRAARAGDPDPEIEVAKKHFRLGAQFYENGDYANALNEFETAKRVKPLPAFDYNIGLCYDRLERYTEAVAAYERFMAGTPDPFEAEEARARIKVLKERAGKPVPKVGEKDAEANKMLEKGIALFKDGKLAEARAVFFQLRKLVPDKANPHRWLGMTYARLGQCPEAITNLNNFLERVAEDDPRVAEVTTIRDRCKDELQPKTGTLVIESTPPGAEVLLDDEKGPSAGRTPYRSTTTVAGEHVVYLRKPGFETLSKHITLGKKETVNLDVSLRPIAPPPIAVAPPPKPKPVEKVIPVEKPKPPVEKPVSVEKPKPPVEKPVSVEKAKPPVEKAKPVVAMVEKATPVPPGEGEFGPEPAPPVPPAQI